MSKMIQLCNVPDALHRQLKARAALEGLSLSDYLIREVRRVAERPTAEQMRARLEALPAVDLTTSPTALLRQARDSY